MSDVVLKIENVSKQYRLGEVGTGTISHDLNRWWHKVRGKEDPFLKIGETNDRTQKGESEYAWALRDINFDVQQGEVLGIIGKNGAGKSTLLKILSKVTGPTTGSIKSRGRIASLLEVGTGFHPELTGRENVYLNGAIMGMTKKEVSSKLDEIVDFAGVERYLDTPVKRYSSGMMVRLGFSVAAHLEPEILIVDEVLAVGDIEFQKKCIGKMGDVAKGGRTILFVSHNMSSVRMLCSKGLILTNGQISYSGDVGTAIEQYVGQRSIKSNLLSNSIEFTFRASQNLDFYISGTRLILNLYFKGRNASEQTIVLLTLESETGERIVNMSTRLAKLKIGSFKNRLSCQVETNELFLMPRTYFLSCRLLSYDGVKIAEWENFSFITVVEDDYLAGISLPSNSDRGMVNSKMKWSIQEID